MPHSRIWLWLVLVGSAASLGVALIAQYIFDMQPCAWCVLQRMVLVALALVAALGLAIGSRRQRALRAASYASLMLSILGAMAAYYQATVASSSISCDLSTADRIVRWSKIDDLLPSVFGVYSSCADANIVVFGLEFAWWAFMLFLAGVCATVAACRAS